MANVDFINVTKMYDKNTLAVNNFNLTVKDGEFVVFVGPSGCGKSTTLRMLAGLEDISGGEIRISGKRVNEVPPAQRNIAMVFQTYALYPHKSVYKNLSFALEIAKVPKDEIDRKVHEAAEMLDLTKYLKRKPKALSGGQRQRVALGRAMVREPGVFLLDEPLSNLDAKLRTSMRTRIKLMHKRLNTTFIYVTHDQVEAMTLGDRIVVMKDGILQQADTPVNIYNKPCNTFVAGFIGTPPINLLNAKLEQNESGRILAFQMGQIELNGLFSDKLGEYEGKELTVGVRPEWVTVSDDSGNGFPAEIENVEAMGNETVLHLISYECRVTAKVKNDKEYNISDTVFINFKKENLLFFDPETDMLI